MEAFFFGCVKWPLFSKQELILRLIELVTVKEWLVLRNKLNYTHTKIGAKVQTPRNFSFNRVSNSNVNYL